MEEMNIQLHSIWGKWWTPVRKWFYPVWLAYETLIRFYKYAVSVQNYFGEIGSPILGAFCAIFTFIICTAFLTVPSCFILYNFFDTPNLTGTSMEARLKPIL